MAVRALQRALGPKGLGQWQDNPDKAWVEGCPTIAPTSVAGERVSVRLPLFGEDMKYLIRQGNLALAQGQFKLGNFKEAAALFDQVLKEGAPSLSCCAASACHSPSWADMTTPSSICAPLTRWKKKKTA